MFKFISLASGSKGNSSLIVTDTVNILIDCGIPLITLKNKLNDLGYSLDSVYGVLITHIHSDHVKGLNQLVNHYPIKVLVPEKMIPEIMQIINTDEIIEIIDDEYSIFNLNINLIYTSHDVDCSVGYVISYENKSMVYITDTGYINKKYFDIMKNHNLYFMESNHDEVMLMEGPYPYYLKQRVISDVGHLSNKATAKYLSTLIGDKTKNIVLAHISENNNLPDLAIETTTCKIKSDNIKVDVASQYETTYIEV